MTVVRAGGYQGPGSVHTQGLHALGEALDRLSHGAVRLELTTNVTEDGSPATSLLARVASGQLDLCYFASSYLAARAPALAAFDLPFPGADRVEAYGRLDGALGELVADAVRLETEYCVLGFWDNGFRHLSNRVRAIAHPRDCQGLTIRTLDNTLHHAVFSSLGFAPVTVDVRDLVHAVQSGQVDAQENPLTNTVGFGLHEWHRRHSLTGHFFGVALLLANRAWFDGLAADVRSVLQQAATAATVVQRGLAAREEIRGLTALQAAGAEVLDAADLDLAAFRAAVQPVREQLLAALDPALRALL